MTNAFLPIKAWPSPLQACSHCHVESSPLRTEAMDRATADRALQLLQGGLDTVHTLDITGGAPELSPQFRSDTSVR